MGAVGWVRDRPADDDAMQQEKEEERGGHPGKTTRKQRATQIQPPPPRPFDRGGAAAATTDPTDPLMEGVGWPCRSIEAVAWLESTPRAFISHPSNRVGQQVEMTVVGSLGLLRVGGCFSIRPKGSAHTGPLARVRHSVQTPTRHCTITAPAAKRIVTIDRRSIHSFTLDPFNLCHTQQAAWGWAPDSSRLLLLCCCTAATKLRSVESTTPGTYCSASAQGKSAGPVRFESNWGWNDLDWGWRWSVD